MSVLPADECGKEFHCEVYQMGLHQSLGRIRKEIDGMGVRPPHADSESCQEVGEI